MSEVKWLAECSAAAVETSLFEAADSIDRDRAGRQLACFLAALHQPPARQRAEAAIGTLSDRVWRCAVAQRSWHPAGGPPDTGGVGR